MKTVQKSSVNWHLSPLTSVCCFLCSDFTKKILAFDYYIFPNFVTLLFFQEVGYIFQVT